MSKTMSCEKLNELLPAYLEGALPDAERLAVEAHAGECAACGGLVRDIQRISRDAASLAPLIPSRDLWSGIEARISAPVIPLAGSAGIGARRYGARRQWYAGAAAAAVLMLTTAGITYLIASRRETGSAQKANRQAEAVLPAAPALAASAPQRATETSPVAGGSSQTAALARTPLPRLTSSGSRGGAGSSALAANASGNATADQAGAAYSQEISALERIVKQRSSTLDPATIQLIERNLRVIDAAVAQSMDAIARNPASKLLYDQLTHTLDKKVELLRTAALLPSST